MSAKRTRLLGLGFSLDSESDRVWLLWSGSALGKRRLPKIPFEGRAMLGCSREYVNEIERLGWQRCSHTTVNRDLREQISVILEFGVWKTPSLTSWGRGL